MDQQDVFRTKTTTYGSLIAALLDKLIFYNMGEVQLNGKEDQNKYVKYGDEHQCFIACGFVTQLKEAWEGGFEMKPIMSSVEFWKKTNKGFVYD